MQHLKKITLLSLLFVSAFSYSQETGPSKEVTVQSINKYMNEAVGMKTYNLCFDDDGNYSNRCSENTITVNSFGLDKISRIATVTAPDGNYSSTTEYTLMNWGNISKISVDSSENLSMDKEMVWISIDFSSKVLYNSFYTAGATGDYSDYYNGLVIFIPRNRVEACLKALNHLKELSKVDDPFDDH